MEGFKSKNIQCANNKLFKTKSKQIILMIILIKELEHEIWITHCFDTALKPGINLNNQRFICDVIFNENKSTFIACNYSFV